LEKFFDVRFGEGHADVRDGISATGSFRCSRIGDRIIVATFPFTAAKGGRGKFPFTAAKGGRKGEVSKTQCSAKNEPVFFLRYLLRLDSGSLFHLFRNHGWIEIEAFYNTKAK